ncbi:MAG: response regulator [Zoogloeaceae bacterium]|jgi:DNA-binding NtrC family response regulator|nr:response regulator [Zoogloeaceae bacterium]
MADILIVDDEPGIRELLSEILTDEGHNVRLAENAAEARKEREARCPDAVLLDIWMPDTDGISLLKEWSISGQLTMPVVMMSGHGTIDTAIEATRIGAVDFLEKPISLQKLLDAVQKALKHEPIGQQPTVTLHALTHAPLFRDLRKRLEQSSAKSDALFILGGTGLIVDLCARTLQRPRAPWLNLSAFTGTLSQETLQKTAGGIVYVNDLAALSKLQQMNLAFALEGAAGNKLFIVTASSLSLDALAERGWSSQLLKRATEISLMLPALEQHNDDLPEICALFLSLMIERQKVPLRRFSSAALNVLRTRWGLQNTGDNAVFSSWYRLESLIRNLALGALDEEISEEDVIRFFPVSPPACQRLPEDMEVLFTHPLRNAREAFEKCYFEYLLKHERGNMTRVSERSGLERTHLYRKLKQLGMVIGRRNEAARSEKS